MCLPCAGFPDYTYELKYPAPGDAALSARIVDMLTAAGVETRADRSRGFDHGVFVPMMLVLPAADVPVVQVSLHSSLDPLLHARIGSALAPLRKEGVLIIGSGATTHNLGAMRAAGFAAAATDPKQAAFVDWLTETVTAHSGAERLRRLINWRREAPSFRAAHPREEHILPIIPIVAAASDDVVIGRDGTISEAPAPAASASVGVTGEAAAVSATAPATRPGAGTVIHEAWALGNMAQHAYAFK